MFFQNIPQEPKQNMNYSVIARTTVKVLKRHTTSNTTKVWQGRFYNVQHGAGQENLSAITPVAHLSPMIEFEKGKPGKPTLSTSVGSFKLISLEIN